MEKLLPSLFGSHLDVSVLREKGSSTGFASRAAVEPVISTATSQRSFEALSTPLQSCRGLHPPSVLAASFSFSEKNVPAAPSVWGDLRCVDLLSNAAQEKLLGLK